jgi:hypothetical protein
LSKKDLHPALRHSANLDGFSENADLGPEDIAYVNAAKMMFSPPAHRMNALNQLDAEIGREDATLRQRSQLVTVRRRLSQVHEKLLKAGR